jgi:Flp pilus assembly protein TadG
MLHTSQLRNSILNGAWRSTVKIHLDLREKARSLRSRHILPGKFEQVRADRCSLFRRVGARLQSESEGNSLVEMALALPVFLAVVTGIFAFGIAFNNELTLSNAVGAGAQYLQLIRTSTTDPCADTLAAIQSAAPGLQGSSINLTFNFNGTSASGNSCAGDESELVQGAPVTVTATYPCTLSIYGTRFTSACQVAAKVTEYEY